ncbi:MAG: glycine oxidase ThiO [Vicinamibacterales bacterium]
MHVTIVGAGIVGLALAHELTLRGAAVRLVDMRGRGLGATQASAGMLAPYIEGQHPDLLDLGVRGIGRYDEFIARLRTVTGAPVEYRRCGTLQVATDAAEFTVLDALARRFAGEGVPHGLLGASEVRRADPSLSHGVCGALLLPQHGYVSVSDLVAALAAAVEMRGGVVVRDTVLALEPTGAGVRVVTADSRWVSDAAVVATGSWSGAPLGPVPGVPVRPIRGQLLHLRAAPDLLRHVTWGNGCYLVPWADGSLLLGATVEDVGFDERATVAGVRMLLERGQAILPGLDGAELVEVRVGLRPATPDELPIVGPVPGLPGVFRATGHYRSGVLLAPLTAHVLATLMCDGDGSVHDDGLALMAGSRFPAAQKP